MPRERGTPDDPREWLRRANSNPERARADSRLPDVYLEDLCFDAQQTAERATKAVLIHLGVSFPHIHDLAALLTLAEQSGGDPGEAVTDEEYRAAVEIAETVVDWAETRLSAES